MLISLYYLHKYLYNAHQYNCGFHITMQCHTDIIPEHNKETYVLFSIFEGFTSGGHFWWGVTDSISNFHKP